MRRMSSLLAASMLSSRFASTSRYSLRSSPGALGGGAMIVGGAFGAGVGTESSENAFGTSGIELGTGGAAGIVMTGAGGGPDAVADPPPCDFFFPGGM